jgi:hypothetical protein
MTRLTTRALDASTWPDFASLVERHNGVWGGCWCMAFHAEGTPGGRTPEENRALKEGRVREGRAHAALVYEGPDCVGWCQYGSADELPRIKNLREYRRELAELPDWRITCFFVGRGHRRQGVADAALRGALDQIAHLGGGVVEAYGEDVAGRKASGSFLWGGTVQMFEGAGFARDRQIGKHTWVMRREVPAGRAPSQPRDTPGRGSASPR